LSGRGHELTPANVGILADRPLYHVSAACVSEGVEFAEQFPLRPNNRAHEGIH
jgi:hypothetical protein